MSTSVSQPAPLMKTTGWLASANVLRNLGLLAVLVALTNFSTPEAVGAYAIALAITTPSFAFAQMGLRGVYLTHRKSNSLVSYIVVQSVAVALAFLVSVAIGMAIDVRFGATVALVAAFKAADAFAEFFTGPLQILHKVRLVFWGFACSAAVGGAVVAVSLALWGDLNLSMSGLALIAVGVTVAFFAVPVLRSVPRRAGLGGMRGITSVVAAGLPTGLALAVFALVLTFPQYFLAASHGQAAVGAFAVLFYIFAAGDLFTGTLAAAWIPHARQALETQAGARFIRYVWSSVLKWTALYVPITAAGFVLAYFAYPVIFPGYALGSDVVIPLACSILLLPALHFLVAGIAVRNLYTHNLTLGIVSAAASLVACALLIPPSGVVGAFWAVTVGITARVLTAALVLAVDRSRERREEDRKPHP